MKTYEVLTITNNQLKKDATDYLGINACDNLIFPILEA